MGYDNQDIYLRHDGDDSGCESSSCGCCPTGLVSVVDCGKDIGCLTPNDAAKYRIESHIPEIGYVKVFDPRTGEYLGDMTSTEAITYITYLETLPDLLNIQLSTSPVLCNGESTGSASAIIIGGVAPYVLTWSAPDPSALSAGSYTLTVVDDNGISGIVSFNITEPLAITATFLTKDDSGAGDGTAEVFPLGGVEPYTYLWDDPAVQTTKQAIGLASGSYGCQIKDSNSCIFIKTPIIVS